MLCVVVLIKYNSLLLQNLWICVRVPNYHYFAGAASAAGGNNAEKPPGGFVLRLHNSQSL